MESQYRRGLHKRLEFGVCRNGHDISAKNTKVVVWGGLTRRVCLDCCREREADPKRIAYQKNWEQRNAVRRAAQKKALRVAARMAA